MPSAALTELGDVRETLHGWLPSFLEVFGGETLWCRIVSL
jgi:hypothetical protein